MARRSGSALLLAVLVLLLVDCIVLGTIQLARLERRLAGTNLDVVHLRLAAEAVLAQAIAGWPTDTDSLGPGDLPVHVPVHTVANGYSAEATMEALPGGVFIVQARVRESAPRTGTATAARLLLPPALPASPDPAAAALSTNLLMAGGGTIEAAADSDCQADRPAAVRASAVAAAGLPGIIGELASMAPDESLATLLPRLIAGARGASGVQIENGDYALDGAFTGVLLVAGSITLQPGAELNGLLVTGADIHVLEGGSIRGAAHAGGAASVEGHVRLDSCAVTDAVSAAGLRTPQSLTHRPIVPGF